MSRLITITIIRIKSMTNAVSPDLTYSQSYLDLLSALAVMLGIFICCTPAIFWLIVRPDRRSEAPSAPQSEQPVTPAPLPPGYEVTTASVPSSSEPGGLPVADGEAPSAIAGNGTPVTTIPSKTEIYDADVQPCCEPLDPPEPCVRRRQDIDDIFGVQAWLSNGSIEDFSGSLVRFSAETSLPAHPVSPRSFV